MNDLHIEASKYTPLVDFRLSGEMLLQGISVPEDSSRFFEPLLQWTRSISAKRVTLTIRLAYFNTSSTKSIYLLLKELDVNNMNDEVVVNWFYEEDDEDILESGKYYAGIFSRIRFEYFTFAQIS